MPPDEMSEAANPPNAAEQLFGNTTDYDEEIEEMLVFKCLHGDYHDIGLHLYELHPNGDDGAHLATRKILKVDEQQLICLRGVGERHMARAGIDFFSTRLPMASLTAIRLIFSIAVHYNTCILHADVPNAFCQGGLDTRTLLRFPKGVSLEHDKGNSSVLVLLRKALYGLRKSPQLFNKLLGELLTSCELRRCEQEACIYKYFAADGWILIGCEVDDLIVTGTNEKNIAELQKIFKDKWNVGQWGDIRTFLGMRCQYNRSEGELKLDVEQKIKDMLKRFSRAR